MTKTFVILGAVVMLGLAGKSARAELGNPAKKLDAGFSYANPCACASAVNAGPPKTTFDLPVTTGRTWVVDSNADANKAGCTINTQCEWHYGLADPPATTPTFYVPLGKCLVGKFVAYYVTDDTDVPQCKVVSPKPLCPATRVVYRVEVEQEGFFKNCPE